ncbi:MAG: relaxase/mobilization nuclease domain-containing protein [Clostridia bacterium]|nr:relaxase/mobilization nuclease domain-containing protein [Clostridia bacterium]
MPIFIVRNSKATPGGAMEYITRPGKAAHISVRNLRVKGDYAKQLMDTMNDFGKGYSFDERKYYHCKLSPSREDNISLEDMQRYAEEMVNAVFDPEMQVVIATHFDSGNPHAHIIVGAVNPATGKKLHFTRYDFGYMKDKANEIGLEYGLSPVDFRKKSDTRVKQGEIYAKKVANPSTKDLLKEAITEAVRVSSSEEDFLEYMKEHDIVITRSKTEYSYLYPGAKRAVRGDTLGDIYRKDNILKAIYEMASDDSDEDDIFLESGDDGKTFDPEKVIKLYGDEYVPKNPDGEEIHVRDEDTPARLEETVSVKAADADTRQADETKKFNVTTDGEGTNVGESDKDKNSFADADKSRIAQSGKEGDVRPVAAEKKSNPVQGKSLQRPFVTADTAFEEFYKRNREMFDSADENLRKEMEADFKERFNVQVLKKPASQVSTRNVPQRPAPSSRSPWASPTPAPAPKHDDDDYKYLSK